MNELFLATNAGVLRCAQVGKTWKECECTLESMTVTSIVAREGVILAGTTTGIFRSNDRGRTWIAASEGLDISHVRWIDYHPDVSDLEFAGTEPAGIFLSSDGAESWNTCPEVPLLRDEHQWFLPYSPEAGCVRGFAFNGNRAYTAVEVGGVLRSDDSGRTWRLAGGSTGEPTFDSPQYPLVHADVHSVAVHPSSPDHVFAVTAEGLYCSGDGGDTWHSTHRGSYCRAVWVNPEDPDHIVLGPADSVDRMNGRIEETRDGGRCWAIVSEGLNMPWPDTMVERLTQIGDELFAVTNQGTVFSTSLSACSWTPVLPNAGHVNAVAWFSAV